MRTTLELDDTVVSAARSLARARGISLGAAVSELARRGLGVPLPGAGDDGVRVDVAYSPFPILVGDPDHVVIPELVNAHRDDA